jgi:hypothetical protein
MWHKKLIFILIYLVVLVFCRADDHWGESPPVPELQINHDILTGRVEVGWISDSSFDKPIWYIVEVKQVDENRIVDPEFLWFRPFIPIQSNFNEYISISLNYRDEFGAVKDWSRAEMFRIRAMWGA